MRRTIGWIGLTPLLALSFLAPPAGTRAARADDAPPAAAPTTPWKPLLWVVEGKPTIYLLGTIHIPDKRLDDQPASLKAALDACDVFYGEIPQDAEADAKIGSQIMLPEGKTFEELIPKELYARVVALVAAKGMNVAAFARLKVWVMAVSLGQLDYFAELAQHPPLDKALYLAQAEAKKEVGGVETPEEQLALFDAMSAAQQAKMLEESVKQAEETAKTGKSVTQELMDAYLSGDETKIVEVMNRYVDKDDKDVQALMKALIDDRNVKMVDRLLERAKAAPTKTFFLAVGAAHYPGPNGILALLEKRGLKPRRLGPNDAIPAKAKEPAATK